MSFWYFEPPDPKFPYRVELCASKLMPASEWLHINVTDTGDHGDKEEWQWDRSAITPTHTHMYAFRNEDDATRFALAWS
jgi:hypothetical protein